MDDFHQTLDKPQKRRIGIVGYGNLGKFMANAVLQRDDCELAFVWNRSVDAMRGSIDESYILTDLDAFSTRKADIIVEVAHPSITVKYGERFLQEADYMIGSPTALADASVEAALRAAASQHGLYIPSGAMWGGDDVQKMADSGTLQSLKITMTKHPNSFKLNGELAVKNTAVTTQKTILYDGPVRGLCPLAPNNVNTMAAAAMAAHNLGFDGTQGCIIADPDLHDWHIVEVEATGPQVGQSGRSLHVKTVRSNPAQVGHVTGSATYNSFIVSMLRAHGRGPGVHLC